MAREASPKKACLCRCVEGAGLWTWEGKEAEVRRVRMHGCGGEGKEAEVRGVRMHGCGGSCG